MSQPHLKVRMKSWERVLKTKSGSGFIVFYQGPKPKRQSLSFKVGQDCRKKNISVWNSPFLHHVPL